jgi:hypothetical protein
MSERTLVWDMRVIFRIYRIDDRSVTSWSIAHAKVGRLLVQGGWLHVSVA